MKPNIGIIDRILRILLAMSFAVFYITEIVSGTIGVISLLLSIFFLVTSGMKFCIFYKLIGFNTIKILRI